MKHHVKKLLRESLLYNSFSNKLSAFDLLQENENPNTFEWIIDDTKKDIETKEDAKQFIKSIINKLRSKKWSLDLKKRVFAYSLAGLIGVGGLMSVEDVNDVLRDDETHYVRDVSNIVNKNNNPFETPVPPDDKEITPKKELVIKGKMSKDPSKWKSTNKLKNFIKWEEGDIRDKGAPVLKGYKIGDGMITIGWGHAEPINRSTYRVGQKITVEEAERLLKNDIREAEDAVNDIFNAWKENGINYKITQPMYDAMVSMAFNMGRGSFRKTKFISLMKQGRYDEAKEQILVQNVFYPGHVKRREMESRIFGGQYPT